MDKETLLALIQSELRSGTLTEEDVRAVVGGRAPGVPAPAVHAPTLEHSSKNLVNVFYAIGAIIALIGAVILVAQYWEDIGFLGRILVTLGISLVTYFSAMMLRAENQRVIAQVFFTIAAVLAPLGVFVLLSENGVEFTAATQALVGSALFVVYITAYLSTRRNILVLLSTGFATWAFYAFLGEALPGSFFGDVFKWATMVAGASYLLLGYWYRSVLGAMQGGDEREKQAIGGVLYAFGTLALLTAGIVVGGFFDLIFIALVFGVFYLSVFLKSRAMLVLSALFLIGHLIKLTAEYFADSVGWPISLVVIGFCVIGIGVLTLHIHKKFIAQ